MHTTIVSFFLLVFVFVLLIGGIIYKKVVERATGKKVALCDVVCNSLVIGFIFALIVILSFSILKL